MGKEFLELGVELCRQRFVMRQDEGRALHTFDDFRHRIGLARAGDTEQGLMFEPFVQPLGQFRDRFRLVAGRLEGRDNLKIRHAFLLRSEPHRTTILASAMGI